MHLIKMGVELGKTLSNQNLTAFFSKSIFSRVKSNSQIITKGCTSDNDSNEPMDDSTRGLYVIPTRKQALMAVLMLL